MKPERKIIIKAVLIAVLLLVLVLLCVRYLVPLTRLLMTEEGRTLICERVRSFGVFAPLVFLLLMALQIVIAFIPGGPLELIGGMLFGSVLGLCITMLGAVLGSTCVYLLVRKFGKPLVDFFVNEEKMKRFKFLQDEDKLEFWVFVLFLIPGIPKDLLTYIVPLTRIRARDFLLLSNVARFPSIAASVLIGDSLTDGHYRLAICICAAAAILTFVGFRLRSKLLKK